jgi:hypothetical protein
MLIRFSIGFTDQEHDNRRVSIIQALVLDNGRVVTWTPVCNMQNQAGERGFPRYLLNMSWCGFRGFTPTHSSPKISLNLCRFVELFTA